MRRSWQAGERLKGPKPEEKPKNKPKRTRKKKEPGNGAQAPREPNGTSSTALKLQYREAKERHPGMLLLFRLGDYYELYEEDAKSAAALLGLTLTTRDNDTMAGLPHHSLEGYLHKLLKAGHRVAICDEVKESLPRGPIRREVTRVVTPGTMVEDVTPGQETV